MVGAKGDNADLANSAPGSPAASPTAAKTGEPKDNDKLERQILRLGAARDVTFDFLPARDWNATQLRLILPPSVRLADEKKNLILFNGAVKQGQIIRATASLLAGEIGTQQLRLILEQNAGDTFTTLQTQTIVIDVVR